MGDTVFDFDIGIDGAVVVARGTFGTFKNANGDAILTSKCMEGEVDANIQMLKEDLDKVAKRMKVALRAQAERPSFG